MKGAPPSTRDGAVGTVIQSSPDEGPRERIATDAGLVLIKAPFPAPKGGSGLEAHVLALDLPQLSVNAREGRVA